MTSKTATALALMATLGLAGPATADVWDTATDNDNGNGTNNEITHGFSQVHDLGVQPGPVADQDWYRIVEQPFSSYEVLCDGFTGDISTGFPQTLERVDATGTVLQGSSTYGFGFARSLRFANDTSASNVNDFVRVSNAACGTSCTASDQYRIRAWDTIIAVPRYNNFGGQISVLLIQNTGDFPVTGNAYLWLAAGGTVPVTTVSFTLLARQSTVIVLSTVNGGVANGTSGTITITNNGRYGILAVKAVAIEPATGFSFDTPGLYKPVS
jgi:hypothetical protein